MAGYLKVFYDFLETTSRLNDAERGRLVEAMIIYARDGVETEAMIGNEQFLFPVFKAQIDRDRATYADISEKRRAAGSKGGKAKVANASNCKQDKDQEKEEEKEKDKESLSNDAQEVLTTQTRDYIRAYVSEMTPTAWNAVSKFILDGIDEVVIRYAIDRACSHGCSKWCYIEKILRDWQKAGVKTVAQAKAEVAKFEEVKRVSYATNKNQSALNYQQHAYSEKDFGPEFYYDPSRDFLPNGR